MGGVQTASGRGVSASFYNPANLSYVKNFNGLDFKLNSKFDLKDYVNYLTNFDVSGKF